MANISSPVIIRHYHRLSPNNQEALLGQPTRASKASLTADPYHGHEHIATMCSRFIIHLFACPDAETTLLPSAWPPIPRLDYFIAFALHRTRLHSSVTFAAMYLLRLLHARFPLAKGWASHHLFIASLMVAAKVICDDTYSNRSWCTIGKGIFSLLEINRMERKLCSYLEWQLNVEPSALHRFEAEIRRDFGAPPLPFALSVPAPFSNYHLDIPTSKSSFGNGRYMRPQGFSHFIITNSPIPYIQSTSGPRIPSLRGSLSGWPASTTSTTTARNNEQNSSSTPTYILATPPYHSSISGRHPSALLVQSVEIRAPTVLSCAAPVSCSSKQSKIGYQQFAFPVVAVW